MIKLTSRQKEGYVQCVLSYEASASTRDAAMSADNIPTHFNNPCTYDPDGQPGEVT